jgi:hypothetical protein
MILHETLQTVCFWFQVSGLKNGPGILDIENRDNIDTAIRKIDKQIQV